MIGKDKQEESMISYLLGQATEEERRDIEERYLSDNGYLEGLLALEDALVDEYVTGRMPQSQRELFKANLTASQRENIEFTTELAQEFFAEAAQGPTKKKQAVITTDAAAISSRGGLAAMLKSRPAALQAMTAFVVAIAIGLPLLLWISSLRGQRDSAREQIGAVRDQYEQQPQHRPLRDLSPPSRRNSSSFSASDRSDQISLAGTPASRVMIRYGHCSCSPS